MFIYCHWVLTALPLSGMMDSFLIMAEGVAEGGDNDDERIVYMLVGAVGGSILIAVAGKNIALLPKCVH